MVEPLNCISAIYDILSSIFQTGKAGNIRRAKLRQSLDFLRQNSPVLSKFETRKMPNNSHLVSVSLRRLSRPERVARFDEVEFSMENSPWIR